MKNFKVVRLGTFDFRFKVSKNRGSYESCRSFACLRIIYGLIFIPFVRGLFSVFCFGLLLGPLDEGSLFGRSTMNPRVRFSTRLSLDPSCHHGKLSD